MNLKKKKVLAAKTLKVGKERIIFLKPRLEDIKEAITKQDIKDLHKDGAIKIREIRGRQKIKKRVRRKGPGKVRNKIQTRKRNYLILARKLRKSLYELKKDGKVSKREIKKIRDNIKNKFYKSKAHFRETLKIRRV